MKKPIKLKGIKVFKGNDGQFYFSIIGPNGQVIATSEGYTRKWSAWRGAVSAQRALRRNNNV